MNTNNTQADTSEPVPRRRKPVSQLSYKYFMALIRDRKPVPVSSPRLVQHTSGSNSERSRQRRVNNKRYQDDCESPLPQFQETEKTGAPPPKLVKKDATEAGPSTSTNLEVISQPTCEYPGCGHILAKLQAIDDKISLLKNNHESFMEDISVKFREMKNDIEKLVQPKELSRLPRLPVKSLEELLALEESVLTDALIEQELLLVLRYSGGHKESDAVGRCLEKLLTNYVAQFCSWTGKKNNFKMCTLKLMSVVKQAARFTFSDMTDEKFERCCMYWLQHAHTRLTRGKN